MSTPSEILKIAKESLTEEPWSSDLPQGWVVVKDGDWTDCHKSESKTDIIKHVESGLLFRVEFSRTGDYWQGYETSFDDIVQVEAYQKVITAYRDIKTQPLEATIAMAKGGLHE